MSKWEGSVTVVQATDKALLVEYGNEKFWIPKSQIHDDSEIYSSRQVGDSGNLVIQEWLAKRKGLTED